VSDNLVKDYLEEIGVALPAQHIDNAEICDDEWEIYEISKDTLTYVRYELTGKIGYAFCTTITCKRLTIDLDSFYHVVSYGNRIKEEWECDQSIKDALVSNAIDRINPFNS